MAPCKEAELPVGRYALMLILPGGWLELGCMKPVWTGSSCFILFCGWGLGSNKYKNDLCLNAMKTILLKTCVWKFNKQLICKYSNVKSDVYAVVIIISLEISTININKPSPTG